MPRSIHAAAHRSLALGTSLMLLAPGCVKPGAAAQGLTQAPTMESVTGEAKCGVRSSAAKPLVVEWPAAERAALEARAARGLVAVRYQGCEMEVLTNCTASGLYEYVGLTQKREGVKITNADELYAQLPVGAAGLEAKLERSGQLNVDMVIVGRREADKNTFSERDLEGRCDTATHVITGLTVGSFQFYSGAGAEIGAGVKAGNVGVGGSSSSETELLKSDGDANSCAVASTSDAAAPEGCAALLRVEVVPVDRIFGGPTVASHSSPSSSSPSSSGSSAPVDNGPIPGSDPALEKKIRNAKVLVSSGYLGMLGGLGLLFGGAAVYRLNKAKLTAEVGQDTVSGDRQSNIAKAQTGLVLVYAGAGLAGLGLGLTLWGTVRIKNLRNRAAMAGMAATPLLGPGMAGLSVQGRF